MCATSVFTWFVIHKACAPTGGNTLIMRVTLRAPRASTMGVFNRCNTVEFRRQGDIEGALMGDGSTIHQMRA